MNYKPFLAATMAFPVLAMTFRDASQILPCLALGLVASAVSLRRIAGAHPHRPTG